MGGRGEWWGPVLGVFRPSRLPSRRGRKRFELSSRLEWMGGCVRGGAELPNPAPPKKKQTNTVSCVEALNLKNKTKETNKQKKSTTLFCV